MISYFSQALRNWRDRDLIAAEHRRNAIVKAENEAVHVKSYWRRKPSKSAAYIATNTRLAVEMGKPSPFRASVGRG